VDAKGELMRKVTLITTGGTIEKTYDEATGRLENRHSIVRRMLGRLRLEDVEVKVVELLSKDSLDMVDEDRRRIVEAARQAIAGVGCSGIVILHGTDTLATTGELVCREIASPKVPLVLTGAMRPFEMEESDALQNLTEAIFATGILGGGVYCVAHGKALRFPGVAKDRDRGTFVGTSVGR
jgi:L-asparaginase